MTDLTVPLIGDRLHAINKTLSTVRAERYFPTNYAQAAFHPLLVAVPGRIVGAQDAGLHRTFAAREWSLLLIIGAVTAGILSETAQKNGEALLDPIYDLYRRVPQLQLAGQPTYSVDCRITGDSGIQLYPYNNALASITFTLNIAPLRGRTLAAASV